MLHSLLFAPFEDPARQAQYEAVRAALEAEPGGAAALLLGNVAVEGEVVDALVVRPHSLTVLQLVPGGGRLHIPAAGTAPWQLSGQPLPWAGTTPNPFNEFQRQQQALADWLGNSLSAEPLQPEQVTGLVLFAEDVVFDASVEQYLRAQPGADQFQLLGTTQQLPRRLQQLANPDLQLFEEDFATWWQELAAAAAAPEDAPHEPAGFWEQKARQLWHWLGAEDVPHDAPYGGATVVAASQEEKERLEQLRQQVRDELQQQRQQMEAREAEREQSIAQLRAQLTQAPAAATEVAALQARLATETREKQQLEAAIQASRAEAAARNQELDARIQQLGQLIQQLQTQPVAPAPVAAPAKATPVLPAPAAAPAVAPARPAAPRSGPQNLLPRQSRWQLQWPRMALLVTVVAVVGAAAWGLIHYAERPQTPKATEQQQDPAEPPADDNAKAAAPTLTEIQPDTVTLSDEEANAQADSIQAASEAEATPEPPSPAQGEVMDSVPEELPDGI